MTTAHRPATPVAASSRRGAKPAVVLAFCLGYLWELFGAVSNLLAWLQFAALSRAQLTAFAWLVLVLGLVIPVLAFVLGLLLARGRGAASTARILLVAFCASEALTLSVLAFFEAVISSR